MLALLALVGLGRAASGTFEITMNSLADGRVANDNEIPGLHEAHRRRMVRRIEDSTEHLVRHGVEQEVRPDVAPLMDHAVDAPSFFRGEKTFCRLTATLALGQNSMVGHPAFFAPASLSAREPFPASSYARQRLPRWIALYQIEKPLMARMLHEQRYSIRVSLFQQRQNLILEMNVRVGVL